MTEYLAGIDTHALYWAALSLVLLAAEAMYFTSVLIWFGAGAAIVAITLLYDPGGLGMAKQIILFVVASSILLLASRKLLRKTRWLRTSGDIDAQIRDAHDCTVDEVSPSGQSGYVIFAAPFMGDRRWQFASRSQLEPGDQVEIVEVRGNILAVQKKENN